MESGKSCYVILKQPVPDDKYLLGSHLESTLLDFDQNVQCLDESENSSICKNSKQRTFKIFFIGDELSNELLKAGRLHRNRFCFY